MSSATDYTIHPATGRRERRMPPAEPAQPLRDRHQRHGAVRPQAHLHGSRWRAARSCRSHSPSAPIRSICVVDVERVPSRGTSCVADALPRAAAASSSPCRTTSGGPADAEMTLEGYLDERGYVEPEGPFGEYMGYYGAIHMDPVFHCTAITMRKDVLHHTLQHGSAFVPRPDRQPEHQRDPHRSRGDANPGRPRGALWLLVVSRGTTSGGSNTMRISIRQRSFGEARLAISALFGGIRPAQAHLRLRRGYRHPQRPAGRMGARNAFPGRPGSRDPAGHSGNVHGPLPLGTADRSQVGLRLHQAVRAQRRDSADPRSAAKSFKGPAPLPEYRTGARHRTDVLCRPGRS